MSEVARDDVGVDRKTAAAYFDLLEDLLIATRVPVFTKRAKRRMTAHPKFFLFDAGVYRAIRPTGPLDSPEEIDGPALETLVYQELRAAIAYRSLKLDLFFWRTASGTEVDFVAYGGDDLIAIEVKRTRTIRRADLHALKQFRIDYPIARVRAAVRRRPPRTPRRHRAAAAGRLHADPGVVRRGGGAGAGYRAPPSAGWLPNVRD